MTLKYAESPAPGVTPSVDKALNAADYNLPDEQAEKEGEVPAQVTGQGAPYPMNNGTETRIGGGASGSAAPSGSAVRSGMMPSYTGGASALKVERRGEMSLLGFVGAVGAALLAGV